MDSLMVAQGISQDGLPDDRVTCGTCAHFRAAGKFCKAFSMLTWSDLPVRCMRYQPLRTEPDQRTGVQRWPRQAIEIAEVRALDAAHEAAKKEKALA